MATAIEVMEMVREEVARRSGTDQPTADARADEFDLLVREAMFANASNDVSARAATFTTTPRGMQGPYKTVLDPSVPEVEYDDETEAALLSALA